MAPAIDSRAAYNLVQLTLSTRHSVQKLVKHYCGSTISSAIQQHRIVEVPLGSWREDICAGSRDVFTTTGTASDKFSDWFRIDSQNNCYVTVAKSAAVLGHPGSIASLSGVGMACLADGNNADKCGAGIL